MVDDLKQKTVRMQKLHKWEEFSTFSVLERKGKGRELCLLSANSYGIRDGVKRNIFFLQKASMRKLIKGKHEKRCSFLERKGDRRSRWIVDSTLFE